MLLTAEQIEFELLSFLGILFAVEPVFSKEAFIAVCLVFSLIVDILKYVVA